VCLAAGNTVDLINAELRVRSGEVLLTYAVRTTIENVYNEISLSLSLLTLIQSETLLSLGRSCLSSSHADC
jgi:hypothetical protein